MIRFALAAILLTGCRISLEPDVDASSARCNVDMNTAACVQAATHSDLPWIETNVFATSCLFPGCHNGPTDLGKLDLRVGMSFATLVNVTANLDRTRKRVVPNDIHASYLMLMLHDFPPEMANPPGSAPSSGYMPLGLGSLCCQKLDAIERWITAGATAN